MATHKWVPSPSDATTFAAFRWFANTIENYSIEIFTTNRAKRERIEEVLRETVQLLAEERAQLVESEESEDCPPGYVLCDGLCMPSCDAPPHD